MHIIYINPEVVNSCVDHRSRMHVLSCVNKRATP